MAALARTLRREIIDNLAGRFANRLAIGNRQGKLAGSTAHQNR
jgi:hypothetical protein